MLHVLEYVGVLLQTGLGSLAAYLAAHVLLCLLPAFFIAGALTALIPLARIILSIVFGVGIGLLMSWFFRKDDADAARRLAHSEATNGSRMFAQGAKVPDRTWVFFVLLLAVLIAGTLQVGLLTNSYATFTLPGVWADSFQGWLDSIVPPNPSLGVEGVSVHGVLLIVPLILIAVTAWLGLNKVDEGFNGWTYAALGLITLTLVVASFKGCGGRRWSEFGHHGQADRRNRAHRHRVVDDGQGL